LNEQQLGAMRQTVVERYYTLANSVNKFIARPTPAVLDQFSTQGLFGITGVDVMSTIFYIFSQFSAKKLCVFLENQCYDQVYLHITGSILSKNDNFCFRVEKPVPKFKSFFLSSVTVLRKLKD
jgi:hypothetical protein